MAPPDSFTNEVLFVNEDPSASRRRTRQVAFAINSHVNGKYTRWRRQESIKQLRTQSRSFSSSSSDTKDEDHSSPESSRYLITTLDFSQEPSDLDPVERLNSVEVDDKRRRRKGKAPKVSPELKHEHSTTTLDGEKSMSLILNQHSPISFIQKGNSDPFNATPVPLTARNHHAVKFACEYHVTNIWPSELSHSNPENLTNVKWWISPRQSIETNLTMLGMLCRSLEVLHRDGILEDSLKVLEFKNTALIALRQHMQSLSDFKSRLAAYETMLYFGATEWNARNPEAMIAHYRGAKSVLADMGGFDVLDTRWKETSVWAMVNVTFTFPIRSRVSADEFDPGPWTDEFSIPETLSLTEVDEVVTGIDSDTSIALIVQIAGSVLAQSIADLRELLRVEEAEYEVSTSLGSHENPALKHWIFMRKLAIRARLVDHFHDLSEPLQAIEYHTTMSGGSTATVLISTFEMCLCLALMLFEITTFEKHAFGMIWSRRFRWIRGRHELLVGSLEKLVVPQIRQETEETMTAINFAILWMFFIGAYAEVAFLCQKPTKREGKAVADAEFAYKSYCAGIFSNMARSLGFETAEQISTMFKKHFVFCTRTQEGVLAYMFNNS